MRCVVAVLSAAFLEACIALPIPHAHPYSPALSGTVVDAQTSLPIMGAEIRIESKTHDPPLVAVVRSRNDGRFSVVVSKLRLWFPIWLGPAEGFCAATAIVSAPGYESQKRDFSRFSGASGAGVCSHYEEVWTVSLSKGGT
jgi:hypothetical protein